MRQQVQLADHAAAQPGRVAGDAVRHRPDARGPAEAAGRHRQHVVGGQHLQHASRQARRARQGRRAGGGPGRPAVQHHRRERRHLDGDRRHELLAAVARPDRGFDRDGGRRPVVRRGRHDSRLRQEHAGLGDGDAAAESAVHDGLRRHDQARLRAREAARRDFRVPVVRRIHRGRDHRPTAARHRHACVSRRGRVRRHVHRQHDGDGDRGARPVAAVQLVDAGRGPGQEGRVPSRRGDDSRRCSRRT